MKNIFYEKMVYKIKMLRKNAKLKIYGKSKIVSISDYLSSYGHLKYNFIELTQRYDNLKNQYEYKVFHGKDNITDKFPKRVTFGEMLNMMRQSNAQSLYFQREDWRGTHNFISLNDTDGRNLYLEYYLYLYHL